MSTTIPLLSALRHASTRPRGARAASVAVAAALVLAPSSAWAAQFVVTDVTYTHSSTTTTDSHYRVLPSAQTPANWSSPVDYAKVGGTAHVRLEVFTKPTTAPTRYQICFEATPSYACTDQSPAYTAPGIYDWVTEFPKFYQYDKVDWSKGILKAALILKDTKNVKPAPENVGAATSAMYMPTDLRVTVTIVSPGGTYVPPSPTMDGGAVDASAPDAAPADASAPTADAATEGRPDAAPADGGVGGLPDEPPPGEASDSGCTTTRSPGEASSAAVLGVVLGLAMMRRRLRASRPAKPGS